MEDLLTLISQVDGDVRGQTFVCEDLSSVELGHVEFEDCVFESCAFSGMVAERISFDRCTFDSCDFSNARMPKSYWRDCTVRASRLVGCDLHQSYFVRDSFSECACSYANFTEGKLEQVSFVGCDLRETSLAQLKLKRFRMEACDLTRAELFGSRLRGVDLSTCNIQGIRVSNTFFELRDARIGLDQAPDLVSLLGVKLI
ncbi:MAG: pentapeptide repeat-containing protein [Atopobiaceae bacterium]|nr:pentapeptide repeat-containing protein [Atopobiaceae bacterium]